MALQAGSLFIDWAVNFSTPQINPSAAIVSRLTNSEQASRLSRASIADIEKGSNVYTISGFIPRRYYGVSMQAEFEEDVFVDLKLVDPSTGSVCTFMSLRDATAGAHVRWNMDADAGTPPAPGYYVTQANDLGEIEAEVTVDAVNLSDIFSPALIFMPIFEEAPFAAPPRVVRHAISKPKNHVTPKTVDFGPCPLCEHDGQCHDPEPPADKTLEV